MHTIFLICENRAIFIALFEEFVVHLIKVLSALFGQSKPWNSVKVKFTYTFSVRRILQSLDYQAEVDSFQTTHFSSLDAMNFQEWELFGSPNGTPISSLCKILVIRKCTT